MKEPFPIDTTVMGIVPSAPVLVLGQPRSGSTVLTRLLNEFPSTFVVNDFYVLQKLDAENLWDATSSDDAALIAKLVFERIEIRATQERNKTLEQSIEMTPKAIDRLRTEISAKWPAGLAWHTVLGKVMTRAAQLAGKSHWGWNTPQDHFHLERIFDAYPNSKVIVQLRQPSAVLESYKNANGPWHEPRRYNPITIGLAWKAASVSTARYLDEKPDQLMFLRFEDLVAKTPQIVERIAQFLELSPMPDVELREWGHNSSFSSSNAKRLKLTGSERALCELVIGSHLLGRGFSPDPKARFALSDVFELVRVGAVSFGYLLGKFLTDRDRRRRFLRLLGAQRS